MQTPKHKGNGRGSGAVMPEPSDCPGHVFLCGNAAIEGEWPYYFDRHKRPPDGYELQVCRLCGFEKLVNLVALHSGLFNKLESDGSPAKAPTVREQAARDAEAFRERVRETQAGYISPVVRQEMVRLQNLATARGERIEELEREVLSLRRQGIRLLDRLMERPRQRKRRAHTTWRRTRQNLRSR